MNLLKIMIMKILKKINNSLRKRGLCFECGNYKNNSSLEKGQGYAKKNLWPQHDPF